MSSAKHDLFHLAKRFKGALFAQPLDANEWHWVHEHLLPSERELWDDMSKADQRHAYEVALKVERALDRRAPRAVIAAALLHDVGKIEANLGTFSRSFATIASNIGYKGGKVGVYRRHNEIGRDLLEYAGSDPLTSQWAYEHELPRSQWTINPKIADALYAADDD